MMYPRVEAIATPMGLQRREAVADEQSRAVVERVGGAFDRFLHGVCEGGRIDVRAGSRYCPQIVHRSSHTRIIPAYGDGRFTVYVRSSK